MDTPFFGSAANYSGRAVTPMAPVYTARRAAKTVVRLARRPRREAYVGPAGRVLGIQAKATPALVERLLAHQMDRSHFSRARTAPPTAGNVLRPPGDPGAETGGWHGRRRTAVRRAGAAALASGLTAAGVLARRTTRRASRTTWRRGAA